MNTERTIQRDEIRKVASLEEEDMISFKPEWMLKGGDNTNAKNGRQTNDKWRANGGDARRTRLVDQRDWNRGTAAPRERGGWDRERGRPKAGGLPSNGKNSRFIPPPMNRSQSAGALFPSATVGNKEATNLSHVPTHVGAKELPSMPKVISAPPTLVKNGDNSFHINREADFPSLQPSSLGTSDKKNDIQNARSRFLKSKSTNALFEHNHKPSVAAQLLEKAKTLEDYNGETVSRKSVNGDVHIETARVDTTAGSEASPSNIVDSAIQNGSTSYHEVESAMPRLKKIPSFSEKVVEALAQSQAPKPEPKQSIEDEEQLQLVPSKPAPPRLIKSRSDRGHLLDHRKPVLSKSVGPKAPDVGLPKPMPEAVQTNVPKSQDTTPPSHIGLPKHRPPLSPHVYRKATSEPQLLHLWKKEGGAFPGMRHAEADDVPAKKEASKTKQVDKNLELRQAQRNVFLEQLRRKEALKNGELVEEPETSDINQKVDDAKEGEEECTGERYFSEEAMLSFMKQLGWSAEDAPLGGEDEEEEGLTAEELLGVQPLDTAQLSKERERRKEHLVQSLRQWQPQSRCNNDHSPCTLSDLHAPIHAPLYGDGTACLGNSC